MYDLLEGLQGRPRFSKERGNAGGPVWSIRNNLKVLLNSRRGSLPHLPEYGLPDLSVVYRNFPDSLEMIRQAIAETIRLYEPRLSHVKVRLVERDHKVFHATYLVSGKFGGEREKKQIIEFKTQLDSDGQMEVI